MPASPDSETRLQSIISTLKTVFSVVIEEGQSNFNLLFRKVKIHDFEYNIPVIKLFNMTTGFDAPVISSMKPIYVLVRGMDAGKEDNEIVIANMRLETPQHRIQNYELKSIKSNICTYLQKNISMILVNYQKIKSEATICSAKDIKLSEATIGTLQIVPVDKPKTVQMSTKLKTRILKRSEVFASNLPIEKKPVSMLLYSKNDLDFFKQKFAEKMNCNKRLIKLSFIYDKLNYKNLQNIKFDAQSQKVFCNFKPKDQLVSSDENAFLIIGSRIDNNASGSMMVINSEFEKFRNK